MEGFGNVGLKPAGSADCPKDQPDAGNDYVSAQPTDPESKEVTISSPDRPLGPLVQTTPRLPQF